MEEKGNKKALRLSRRFYSSPDVFMTLLIFGGFFMAVRGGTQTLRYMVHGRKKKDSEGDGKKPVTGMKSFLIGAILLTLPYAIVRFRHDHFENTYRPDAATVCFQSCQYDWGQDICSKPACLKGFPIQEDPKKWGAPKPYDDNGPETVSSKQPPQNDSVTDDGGE